MVDVSFVIPCFRSSQELEFLVRDLLRVSKMETISAEIILVQDSVDEETSIRLEKLSRLNSRVRLVELSRNFGQQAATVAGIVASSGDLIVTLDDDYQHRPKDAVKLVRELQSKPELDLVYGVANNRYQTGFRSLSGRLFRTVLKTAGVHFADALSPFRGFRGTFRDVFAVPRSSYVSVDVVLSWVAGSVSVLGCEYNARKVGTSGYSVAALIHLAFEILVSSTIRPLRLGIYVGLGGVALSLTLAIFTLFSYFLGGISVPGFTTVTLLILFLGSLQVLILGILGAYLGEIHQRGLMKPLFFVRSR